MSNEEIMALPEKANVEILEEDEFIGESAPINCDAMMNIGHAYHAFVRPSTGERFRTDIAF